MSLSKATARAGNQPGAPGLMSAGVLGPPAKPTIMLRAPSEVGACPSLSVHSPDLQQSGRCPESPLLLARPATPMFSLDPRSRSACLYLANMKPWGPEGLSPHCGRRLVVLDPELANAPAENPTQEFSGATRFSHCIPVTQISRQQLATESECKPAIGCGLGRGFMEKWLRAEIHGDTGPCGGKLWAP